MKKITTVLLASLTAFACFADTPPNSSESDVNAQQPHVLSPAAKDQKTQVDAEYKARKKVADANKDLNKADCETSLEGATKRACKKTARAEAKEEKAAAKTVHEAEKADIKAGDK